MDKAIQGLDYETALCYIDDIIVFGPTIDSVLDIMTVVLERLRAAKLKLKAKKCVLFAKKVKYLGHVITSEGVTTDPPDKVKDVVNWHSPRTVRQVRAFLGMINYYSRFVRNLQGIASPLHAISGKNSRFCWGKAEQKAFEI